ncbi:hypothetical protein [Marinicella rhabdoformis]|uniref:hypothetical protein n=1 Tax=Marinicella rhabdoformis TaxID=2580566 RepID=UPI0012AED290|nr:hypothetical protein [Marinicella rhabdoformis]
MSESNNKNKSQNTSQRLTGEKLNFIIAICAILISAASFYATYLQADAANKQVKAMTLPMVQYEHGNANSQDEAEINFSLVNAGVGPAMIKSAEYQYKGKSYDSLFDILNVCCESASLNFKNKANNPEIDMPQFITSPVENKIIPAQDELFIMRLEKHPENNDIWHALNDIRFEIRFKACYCSLLDECFETNEQTETKAVKSCQ